MNWNGTIMLALQYTGITVPLVLTAVLTALAGMSTWRRDPRTPPNHETTDRSQIRARQAETLVFALLTLWVAGQVVTVTATARTTKLAGVYVTLGVAPWITLSWFCYTFLLTDSWDTATSRAVILLAAGPIAFTVLYATNPWHSLGIADPALYMAGGRIGLAIEYGIGTMIAWLFNIAMVAGGISIVLRHAGQLEGNTLRNALLHVAGAVLVSLGVLISAVGLSPFRYPGLGTIVLLGVMLAAAGRWAVQAVARTSVE